MKDSRIITDKRCKVCSGKMRYAFEVHGCKIAKCVECNLVQMTNENEVAPYDYTGAYFATNKYKGAGEKALLRENSRRLKLLSKYCNNTSKILDAGCATGDFVNFASKVFDVEGCDVSENAISEAKSKYPYIKDKVWVSTIESLKRQEACYDAICLWDVVEHISDPQSVVNLCDYLKAGGMLFISTPNSGALFSKMMGKKWPFMTPPEHICMYDRKSLSLLLKKKGFEIVEWHTKGKWVNVGFLLYKVNRVTNHLVPDRLVELFQKGVLSSMNLYVPTGDVQYLVAKKQ